MTTYPNPSLAADIIIELPGSRIVLIERRNPPHGWALPGGFVDEGEPLWKAAVREAAEETGLRVTLTEQFHTYSDPSRDPRKHVVSTVFIGRARGEPRGGDDAAAARAVALGDWPALVFDHATILRDYVHYRQTGQRPAPDR